MVLRRRDRRGVGLLESGALAGDTERGGERDERTLVVAECHLADILAGASSGLHLDGCCGCYKEVRMLWSSKVGAEVGAVGKLINRRLVDATS